MLLIIKNRKIRYLESQNMKNPLSRVSSVSKVIDEIVTSNADKFIQKAELEQKIEERVIFHVHNEGSYRKASIKLNEEGVPSSLGKVSWGHTIVSYLAGYSNANKRPHGVV
jgi:hypothetical protein